MQGHSTPQPWPVWHGQPGCPPEHSLQHVFTGGRGHFTGGGAGRHVQITGGHVQITGGHLQIIGGHLQITGRHLQITGRHVHLGGDFGGSGVGFGGFGGSGVGFGGFGGSGAGVGFGGGGFMISMLLMTQRPLQHSLSLNFSGLQETTLIVTWLFFSSYVWSRISHVHKIQPIVPQITQLTFSSSIR
ncbi:hypothetical protein M0R45_008355 [Rubus argutus]|uniref:Uncharacterized protein n=1 Tax=Rubus argutus TaxID=59490 RepID=A0AAW1Y3D0_RUBAR